MKLKRDLLFVFVITAACLVAGCSPDSSGDTQQMPAVTSKAAPSDPISNLPPAAQKAIKAAAPRG